MEYLQYINKKFKGNRITQSFKPYYKWNTFNTSIKNSKEIESLRVLNLIINGIPSILKMNNYVPEDFNMRF